MASVRKRSPCSMQRVHNALARIVLGPSAVQCSGSASMLEHLHLLPVQYYITFKTAKVVFFRTYNSIAPAYLCKLISPNTPSRTLRSASRNLLTIPNSKLHLASIGFRKASSTVSSSLPDDIGDTTSAVFIKRLKTYFHIARL